MKKMNLPQRVKQYMLSQDMVQAESRILVGLSGGGDSVCLLCVLKDLQKEMGFSLEAMHVHHGIRGEQADEDARFCQQLCQTLQIPLVLVYVDVPKEARQQKRSLEEAARMARYRELEAYRKQMGADAVVAVAHHQEDQAETVLWNLLRGGGLRGLSGMSAVNGTLIRPLLEESKEEILSYLEYQKLSWRQDETNDSDDYTRNRIRHHMLAYARDQLNIQSVDHICQAARIAGQADEYLRRQATAWLARFGEEDTLDGVALAKEEEILQQYVLRQWLKDVEDLTSRHMEALQGLLTCAPGSGASRQIQLPAGRRVRSSYGRLVVETAEKGEEPFHDSEMVKVEKTQLESLQTEEKKDPFCIQWKGQSYELRLFSYEKTQKIPTKEYTKWMNYDRIEEALVFRTRQPGDYFLLPDGGRKTVKSYMIDEKIPVDQRDQILVVAQGSHVLWIPGYRLSEGAKVSEETKMILEITRYGG